MQEKPETPANMRVLGVIPARGGSKGIPGKNIRPLAGKPLLQYTAEAALASKRLSRVILSTDDPRIAEVGRICGLEVPFLRPKELAEDDTPTLPVLQHAIKWLKATGEHFDAVMTLQPTSPFRSADDIDGAIRVIEKSFADSVISFVSVGEKHPARMKCIDKEGWVHDPPFAEASEGLRRQELMEVFLRDGSIYLTRIETVMAGSLKGSSCRAWIVPVERACNIDSEWDWSLAELMLKHYVATKATDSCR